jgi:hypothetical protein
MHSHPPTAPSRVRLGTVIVGLALSMLTFGISPAQATAGRAATQGASVHVARAPYAVAVASARASHHGPAHIHLISDGPASSTVDWQWLYGRWQIRFNWAETRQMSRGTSYCNVIAGLIPHWTARVVSAACGILWVLADSAVNQRKCVEAYVSIAPTNPISFGKWNCPT